MTHKQIKDKINELLSRGGSHYFSVEDVNGETIKIRVSDHSANRQNNRDTKTLSFISDRTSQRKSGYNQMLVGEWAIFENGLTDTYQEIAEVLDWHDVANL